jgi:hypothetical protein
MEHWEQGVASAEGNPRIGPVMKLPSSTRDTLQQRDQEI